MTTTLNLRALERPAQLAFQRTVREVEQALPAAHEDAVYGWDQQTRRRNGEVAGSPRNVVDTGELRDSQQPARYTSPLNAVIEWTADHAAATYLGAVFRKREASRPARNVPANTLRKLNPAALFAGHLRRLL
ncbi:hypothetical protein K7W42_19380 [Deinococcus sp. HMF7604]|uniref:hypothetical protein n=1 Tax=Deinococcus betulae TaxID=2873312 RepID=UPI001CCB563A|nr:hypothetical protein [Deinococcus betulae]MBZ9753004.1 hypothetical protein [Deinococcus betulae]